MPLTMVEQGKKVRLVSVDGGHDMQSRLAAMGLVPGAEIEVLGNSSRGPFLIAVKGSRLMIGRGMAHKILVA
ncbi:MAG: ferrous iron transport protein A [Acidobacteria bacterium]|nr:ferrous iron transport protein A [Acidobacteriota bacterium]